jgi:hypothetical protein
MALDRLLREVEAVADLPVHKTFGHELQNFDLARRREVLRLWGGRTGGKLHEVRSRVASSRQRLKTAGVLAIAGQDFLTLSCVHVVAIGSPRDLL